MRGVVFHQNEAAGRKTRAQGQVQGAFVSGGERADEGHAVHSVARHSGQAESRFDGVVRKLARFVPARDFLLLHGRRERAIFQDRASRFVEQTTESENDHFDFFSILAQVSRNATVRLKTGFSVVLSGSTEK